MSVRSSPPILVSQSSKASSSHPTSTNQSTPPTSELQSSFIDPPDLIRRHFSKKYIYFSKDYSSEFLTWWSTTDFQKAIRSGTRFWEKRRYSRSLSSPKWLSTRLGVHLQFYQLAEIKTGEPVYECQSCSHILKHPIPFNLGTSTLKRHIDTCDGVPTSNKQSSLARYSQDGVSASRLLHYNSKC